MKSKQISVFGLISLLLIGLSCKKEAIEEEVVEKELFYIPANFPNPTYDFSKNPITPAGFELGKLLFYDGQLSRDGTFSCGSCHIQASAFSHHGHDLSHGIDDQLGSRNAPGLQNLAWMNSFFWDGNVHDLDAFPQSPIENPVEMDEKVDNVIEKIKSSKTYPALFKKAFGTEEINKERFLKAIAQFQVALISANSRYDKYVRGETGGTLTNDEKEGLALFKQNCATCHAGELFTDNSFRNNGLELYFRESDTGRFKVTNLETDKYKFKVPSLRNVALTGPYMHDGRYLNLQGVLDHYTNEVTATPNLDPLMQQNNHLGFVLSADDKLKIIAFLNTLTDQEFTKDARFAEVGPSTAK